MCGRLKTSYVIVSSHTSLTASATLCQVLETAVALLGPAQQRLQAAGWAPHAVAGHLPGRMCNLPAFAAPLMFPATKACMSTIAKSEPATSTTGSTMSSGVAPDKSGHKQKRMIDYNQLKARALALRDSQNVTITLTSKIETPNGSQGVLAEATLDLANWQRYYCEGAASSSHVRNARFIHPRTREVLAPVLGDNGSNTMSLTTFVKLSRGSMYAHPGRDVHVVLPAEGDMTAVRVKLKWFIELLDLKRYKSKQPQRQPSVPWLPY